MLTPDTEQALVTHSIHVVSVSSPDTDHSVSTPDTNRMHVKTSSSFPLLHHLATQGIPKSRPNTTPNFQAFNSTIGMEVQSTLKPDRWQSLLKHYPDPEFPNIIAGISRYGARVGYEGPIIRIHGHNHPSVLRIPTEISQNIATEVAATRVHQIYTLPQFYYISPLGAVEKRLNGMFSGWRRIHNLSFPYGKSVNDSIREQYGSLMYQTFDDAIHLVQKHGRRCKLRKRDLKDAFRKIPISPLDYWLFLFEWEGKLYVDIFLPFGLRTAPFLFNMFAEGLHWILESFGRDLVHYLDDFLLFNDPDPEFFGNLASYLGLTENLNKRKDGWVVDFTGIELDSDHMIARLPKDKHDRAIASVQRLLKAGTVNHRVLENLLGFLSFCAKVVPLGRPFLRNLFNLLKRLSHLHPHAIRALSGAARRDLLWWMTLLPQWSGVLLINPARQKTIIHTDASGIKGIGGWWESQAFSTRVPRNHRSKLIDWKEAYAVVFAFAKWGHLWKGHTVTIMCDNAVVVNAINAKSVRGQTIDPLQLLFLTAALYDIEIASEWLSSEDNWIADALSRFEFDKITDMFPQFQNSPSHRPCRETGEPMLELRAKLQTFFGMGSLPILAKSTQPAKQHMQDSQVARVSSHSPYNLKRSLNSSPLPLKKRRWKQPNRTLVISEATTLIKGILPTFSTMNASNVS